MNAIHFLHVLVAAVIFLLCMKTSSSESESLFKNGKLMTRCIGKERKALLLFKQGIENKHDDFLESWKEEEEEEECCQWEGVGFDNHTNHVTQLHLSCLLSYRFSHDSSSTSFSIGKSLLDLPYLNYLDLSFNKLAEIPQFIGSISKLVHLNLSYTYRRTISYQIGNLSNLQYLDLQDSYINHSSIPKSIGSLNSLKYLNLAYITIIRGSIPYEIWNLSNLHYLNLERSHINGSIPKSIGSLNSLTYLDLSHCQLYGVIPHELGNLSKLQNLDLGKVPSWIGKDLPNLYALILKSNRFYDRVPREICLLSNLHFLDLSINKISGTIPPCFNNLTTMIQKGTEVAEHSYATDSYFMDNASYMLPTSASYYDNVVARWKGHEFKYGRNIAFLKIIDLSINELTGEIFIEITRLVELKGLNLSENRFYGNIPSEIGRLKELESLDLSTNQFSGEIPASMTGLNFLSYLDLSNSNLTGRIPSGTQLQSFNISAYEGNTGLCGKPLTTICPSDDELYNPSTREEEKGDDITEYDRWFYISVVLGFSKTFWGIIGTLVLNRRWRHAYFLFLNNLKERLFVVMAVRIHC